MLWCSKLLSVLAGGSLGCVLTDTFLFPRSLESTNSSPGIYQVPLQTVYRILESEMEALHKVTYLWDLITLWKLIMTVFSRRFSNEAGRKCCFFFFLMPTKTMDILASFDRTLATFCVKHVCIADSGHLRPPFLPDRLSCNTERHGSRSTDRTLICRLFKRSPVLFTVTRNDLF